MTETKLNHFTILHRELVDGLGGGAADQLPVAQLALEALAPEIETLCWRSKKGKGKDGWREGERSEEGEGRRRDCRWAGGWGSDQLPVAQLALEALAPKIEALCWGGEEGTEEKGRGGRERGGGRRE
jgi:hypothetical protein